MSEPFGTRPLDEKVWQAWRQKGRDRDALASARRAKIGKWFLLVVMPMAALVWLLINRAV